MIFWEMDALQDRFEFYRFIHAENPIAAERADIHLVKAIQRLEQFPELGVKRPDLPGRFLVIPSLSLTVLYTHELKEAVTTVYILRVWHEKRHYPPPFKQPSANS